MKYLVIILSLVISNISFGQEKTTLECTKTQVDKDSLYIQVHYSFLDKKNQWSANEPWHLMDKLSISKNVLSKITKSYFKLELDTNKLTLYIKVKKLPTSKDKGVYELEIISKENSTMVKIDLSTNTLAKTKKVSNKYFQKKFKNKVACK